MTIFRRNLIAQLKEFTTYLAHENGRRVGQPGHDRAVSYLLNQLSESHCVPWKSDDFVLSYTERHPVTEQWQEYKNLVGVISGRDSSLPPILLGAHYDSVIDAPCADDNATSVAMNLAIASKISPGELKRDLIIALFDAEEPPHFYDKSMGSIRFYHDYCDEMDFAGVIVSDLIGHDLELSDFGMEFPGSNLVVPNVRKMLFVLGAESGGTLPSAVKRAASETKGICVFPTLSSYIGAPSDHAAFERGNHPTLFLSCAQGRYYHHEKDDLEWINFKKLAAITDFTESVIRYIDEDPSTKLDKHIDTADFEIEMIKKAVGPAATMLAKQFGISMPTTRDDLDLLLGRLTVGGS